MKFNLPGTVGQNGRTTDKERTWRLVWSYLPDWILTIFLWGIFYLLDKIDGYRRLFSIVDTSLAHPFAEHERIPVWLLAVLCGVIPAVFIILVAAFVRRSFWDAHCGLIGLILCLALSQTLTIFIKNCVGRPRPDLFDRCQPPDDLTENPVHGLTSWTVCTRTDLLQDGFRSFPSGHASFSAAGMWYLILFSAAKMRVNNRRGYTWKAWVLLAPLTCGILVPVSRSMDYRHHATDLIAGSIIGILSAWVGYRSYYPNLSHPRSYKPYSPRIAREEALPLNNRTSAENSAFIPAQANTAQANTSGQPWNVPAHDGEHGYPPMGRKDDNGHGGFSEVSEGNETVERGS